MSYIYLCIYRSWSILHSKALTEKDETQKAAKRDCPENDKTKVLGRIICPKISPQVFFFLFWSSCRVLHISQEIVEIESDLCVCVCQNLHFATKSMVFSWFFHILSQGHHRSSLSSEMPAAQFFEVGEATEEATFAIDKWPSWHSTRWPETSRFE